MPNRSRPPRLTRRAQPLAYLEPLEPRQLLSAVVLATSPVALYNGPGAQGVVGTIGGVAVPANNGMEALHVAVGWDDGTVSWGQVLGHPSASPGYTSTPDYDSQGHVIGTTYIPAPYNPYNPLDIYISSGVHAVRNHLVHVYFWQLDPTGRKIISQANFTTTVAILQNSPGGLTFTGQAHQSFSGKVATLPAGSFPDSLSSPQTSPVTIGHTPSDATLYTVTISWGDGATSNATLVKNSDGTWNVNGTHAYADPGTYRVTVESTEGATIPPGYQGPPIVLPDIMSYTFLAADTAVITPTPPAIQTTALQTFTASLGSIHLPAGETPAKTPVMIAWGDGVSSKAVLVANTSGGYTVMGTHTYTQAGIFSIEITNPGNVPNVISFSPNDNQLRLFQTAVIAPPIVVPG